MPVTDPRVSDAACLAAASCDNEAIQLFHLKPNLIVRDMSKPLDEQVLYTGKDTDITEAETAYKIAFFRRIITVALNIN